jgi:hypothetical protein
MKIQVKFGQCRRHFSSPPKDIQALRSSIQDSFGLPLDLGFGMKVAKLAAFTVQPNYVDFVSILCPFVSGSTKKEILSRYLQVFFLIGSFEFSNLIHICF